MASRKSGFITSGLAVVTSVFIAGSAVSAVHAQNFASAVRPVAHLKKTADPTAEARNHRTALLLLLGVYGELQAARIESDYRSKLDAAASLTDPAERDQAVARADQDRDQRLKTLEDQLLQLAHNAADTPLSVRVEPARAESKPAVAGLLDDTGLPANSTGERPAPAPAAGSVSGGQPAAGTADTPHP